jgi:heterodisulfide reductase subunit B
MNGNSEVMMALTTPYALYLGCIIPNRYPGIELAMRNVAPMLGIELKDMEGASCCPAPGVFKSFDKPTWLALAARNLTIAESLGCDVVTLCNGCYGTLKEANEILKQDTEQRDKVNKILNDVHREFKGKIQARHFIEVLYRDFGTDQIGKMVKKPLNLNVAVHYGCHILRPTKYREIKSSERPTFLDELVEVLGAKSIPYKDKMMCCGAGGGVRTAALDVALDMTREKLQNIKDAGADLIVSPCAFCHLQFDRGQVEIRDKTGVFFNIPVLHYVQFLGLALGLPPEKLGVYNNAVPTDTVIKKI